jgi:exodeoxyribonuclease V
MAKITLSDDQSAAFETISDWLANGGKVHPKQTNDYLLSLGGYAGSGKTTLVSQLAKEFGHAVRFAFCALSGRAASVMGKKLREAGVHFEDGGHYCGTIHRLIYRPIENEDGEIIYWAKKESLDYDVIVLDEASMISQDIYRDLASYGIDILAVGDHGQLPPIEGKFSLMQDPILRLEKIHRQAADNPIINLSMEVRERGRIPKGYKDNEKVRVIKKTEYIDFLRGIFKDAQDPRKVLETAVLCYKNATRTKLNTMIRNMIFGKISPLPLANDAVICLRNSVNGRKIPLYNGFRGYLVSGIQEFDEHFWEGIIDFPYEGFRTEAFNLLRYQFGYPKTFSSFSELEAFGMEIKHWSEAGLLFDYGYALTVHKAQGSQMNNVVLYNERPAPVSEDNYRRWLYTGLTRSSDQLTIIL